MCAFLILPQSDQEVLEALRGLSAAGLLGGAGIPANNRHYVCI